VEVNTQGNYDGTSVWHLKCDGGRMQGGDGGVGMNEVDKQQVGGSRHAR